MAGNDVEESDGKKVISRDEWEQKLAKVQVSKSDLNRLVMNYLVIEGYKEAAEKFAEESGAVPEVELSSIADRMATRMAIQSGDVQRAIEKANDLNPMILDQNPELYFHLQQQKLIELIREGSIDEALTFAQEELAPRGEETPAFLAELEKTMALLAFDDKGNCPVAELLDSAQRQKTASELNAAILSSQCQEKDPKLPHLLRMLVWAQSLAGAKLKFPRMDIPTASLGDPE
eukprot:CAMPEP_0198340738 /NCGR_PEP_ID=MMETSP1450-20131203/45942_1 /TAXON_ID=753684 ORGANISM="Madagascaria erythrocladiodes, Strain CCMP3234" /NCGR_SAMPLE_ID=MMETSP1450 /ASSEMBLY_ACC=CAM_ASM_001115 /LENGTH=231 /DNA_ID=CAMNT_0044045731 /DNA_START=27 /DNA_END=722 /DNA_ORIENTATION=+